MSEENNDVLPQGNGNSEGNVNFGITKDTKASNVVPMLPPTKLETPNSYFPTGYKFPVANLVNVVFNPELETKNGNKTVLQFIFKDKENRQYTHTEWEIDATDAKFNDKLDWMGQRIKHLYVNIFGSFPNEKGIGTNAKNWKDYFKAVKEAFEVPKIEKDGKQIFAYSQVDLYMKLVYYKKNLGFPLAPNFVQRRVKDKPCKLAIKPSESIEVSVGSTPSGLPTMGAIGGDVDSGDFPDFD